MMTNRTVLLNGSLFAAVLAVSTAFALRERSLPEPPPVSEMVSFVEARLAAEPAPAQDPRRAHDALGATAILAPLIPLPTPTPQPSPTPEFAPRIDDVIAGWKVQAVTTRLAVVQPPGGAALTMKVGTAVPVVHRGRSYEVLLESTSKASWAATFVLDSAGEIQRKSLTVF